VVPARSRKAIRTGIKVVLPPNTYGRIASRSGLSFKNGIEVGAGVIDEDYCNELLVILHNHSDTDYVVEERNRIAQLIIERVVYPRTFIEDMYGYVETSDDCIRSIRGLGGFGSTGN
jgi:dUTP pyrophosphatase